MELTVLVFLPAVAAAVIMLLPQRYEQNAKWIALLGSLLALALSLYLFFDFDIHHSGFQYVVRREWVDVGVFHLQYFMGVDGLSLPLVVLTTFLTLASVLVSFSVTMRPRAYYACLMVLATSVLGRVLFARFHALLPLLGTRTVSHVPAHLGLGLGTKRVRSDEIRALHDRRFVVHVGWYPRARVQASIRSISIKLGQSNFGSTIIPLSWVFLLPVHWVCGEAAGRTASHVAARRPQRRADGSLGDACGRALEDGRLRHHPHVHNNHAGRRQPLLHLVRRHRRGEMLYGAFVTFSQTDLKRLIAYSSVSHMGIVLLGIGALGKTGLMGAEYQMLAHGVITGMLFVMVGLMYERTHTREIAQPRRPGQADATDHDRAGLRRLRQPGLPALAGYIAEVTVFLGTFQRYEWAVLMAIFGSCFRPATSSGCFSASSSGRSARMGQHYRPAPLVGAFRCRGAGRDSSFSSASTRR